MNSLEDAKTGRELLRLPIAELILKDGTRLRVVDGIVRTRPSGSDSRIWRYAEPE